MLSDWGLTAYQRPGETASVSDSLSRPQNEVHGCFCELEWRVAVATSVTSSSIPPANGVASELVTHRCQHLESEGVLLARAESRLESDGYYG